MPRPQHTCFAISVENQIKPLDGQLLSLNSYFFFPTGKLEKLYWHHINHDLESSSGASDPWPTHWWSCLTALNHLLSRLGSGLHWGSVVASWGSKTLIIYRYVSHPILILLPCLFISDCFKEKSYTKQIKKHWSQRLQSRLLIVTPKKPNCHYFGS